MHRYSRYSPKCTVLFESSMEMRKPGLNFNSISQFPTRTPKNTRHPLLYFHYKNKKKEDSVKFKGQTRSHEAGLGEWPVVRGNRLIRCTHFLLAPFQVSLLSRPFFNPPPPLPRPRVCSRMGHQAPDVGMVTSAWLRHDELGAEVGRDIGFPHGVLVLQVQGGRSLAR